MFNYIWAGMIIFSIVLSFFTGRANEIAVAASEGAAKGITASLEIAGIMMLWSGLMNIASEGGLIDIFAKLVRPVYRLFFRKIPEKSVAGKNILMNIAANVLGIGNAATPFGIKAMEELGKDAEGRATDEMITFLVLNTASIQLLPATVIALRGEAGSSAPAEILIPVWMVSVFALVMGLLGAKFFRRK